MPNWVDNMILAGCCMPYKLAIHLGLKSGRTLNRRSVASCILHAHSTDGNFALGPVFCLGQCATSPAIMVNDALRARVTPARFDSLIAKAGEAA